jgi:pimeloyl-ACP methyl ester carboxylesterase
MKSLSHRFARTFVCLGVLAIAGTFAIAACAQTSQAPTRSMTPQTPKPTIVLVHGAFAESSSWDGVIRRLQATSYPVIAVANPLRSMKADAAELASVIDAVNGPVVLVGHSYGGMVISGATAAKDKVKALVYVAAFAPEQGESAAQLAGKLPGSTLGAALAPPVPLADGGKDLYIVPDKFHAQFAADVPAATAQLMAATQRPIAAAALDEPAAAPAWKTVPTWFVYGDRDKNIPPAVQDFMAKRAHAVKTVVVKGASHVVMTSQPDVVAKLITEAAASH